MKTNIYQQVKQILDKYKGTIAFRVKKHCEVVDQYINDGEEVLYAFIGQKNNKWYDIYLLMSLLLLIKD